MDDAQEDRLLDARRAEIDGPPVPGADRRRWAIALSGGGIRSATFSIGLLQALAETRRDGSGADARTFRDSLLSRFDLLSTVSGGGYAGAFLCALFKPDRLRDQGGDRRRAADDAVGVLASGPPGRIRSDDAFAGDARLRAPLAWLRENGRYLVPTGVGDAAYAAALGLRNWVALHYVIGTVLVSLLAAMALLRAATAGPWEAAALDPMLQPGAPAFALWWSPFTRLALLPLCLLALPMGLGYWFSYQSKDGRARPFNAAVAGALLSAAALAALGGGSALVEHAQRIDGPRRLLALGGAAALLLGALAYALLARRRPPLQRLRVHMTRWLSVGLLATLGVLALALVDSLGQTLYLRLQQGLPGVSLPAALLGALVWLTKKLAASAPAARRSLARLPLSLLGAVLGVTIFALVATLWSVAVHAVVWNGGLPRVDALGSRAHVWAAAGLLAVALLLAWLTGRFPGFINLSSLQSFYSARLTRAYLGASNRERYEGGAAARSIAEPLPGDNVALASFLAADGTLATLAPLQLINVTLAKTVDPAEQLVQRDRKGQPMVILPHGFAVEGRFAPFPAADDSSEVRRTLQLGQWIGTSGAAFSTGIGRETSLGMSLLMGAANVRLGTWWESGQGRDPGAGWRRLRNAFATQTYLSYELRARFFGLRRRWQYLSDGGHFENTGLYELLRPSRQVALILASDNGADPDYRFADLANLIRLARTDLGVEISPWRNFAGWPALQRCFGQPGQFAQERAQGTLPMSRCALLLQAQRIAEPQARPTWIVLVKPGVVDEASADVRQYAQLRPAFPQEPTTDQFFDEAQWESYRQLGHTIGHSLFAPEPWGELMAFVDNDGVPPPQRLSAA